MSCARDALRIRVGDDRHAAGAPGRLRGRGRADEPMDASYGESVVCSFKGRHDRGLVYEGQKVVPYCARCQTALSNFETRLDDAYRARDDLSVTVTWPLLEPPNEALLAGTTTPWTLPANAALAVHPDLVYVCMTNGERAVWLASNAVERYASQLDGY